MSAAQMRLPLELEYSSAAGSSMGTSSSLVAAEPDVSLLLFSFFFDASFCGSLPSFFFGGSCFFDS